MSTPPTSDEMGVTLVELLFAVLIVALLSALALPSFRGQIDRTRAMAALDLIVAEIYRVRMAAVQTGQPAQLIFAVDAAGCVRSYRVVTAGVGGAGRADGLLDLVGLCVGHSGDSILTFNSRGMLRPPARSLRVSYGAHSDSVLLSIAGRVRRTY